MCCVRTKGRLRVSHVLNRSRRAAEGFKFLSTVRSVEVTILIVLFVFTENFSSFFSYRKYKQILTTKLVCVYVCVLGPAVRSSLLNNKQI